MKIRIIFLVVILVATVVGIINAVRLKMNNERPVDVTSQAQKTGSNAKVDDIATLQTSCNDGNAEDCLNLGNKYDRGKGVSKDPLKAAEFFTKACDLDSKEGCNNLGNSYYTGKGVPQDYVKASEYYKKACDLDSKEGCFIVGTSYYHGDRVQQDYTKASEYYKKACDLGLKDGCSAIANLYFKGEGLKQDYTKASEFFKKACDLGDKVGCSNLLATQNEIINDSIKACKNGDVSVCMKFGDLFFEGKGVTQDYAKATELYQKACKLGNKKGCANVKLVNEKLLLSLQQKIVLNKKWWKNSIIHKDSKEPYKEYEVNSFAFDKVYSGRSILISGKVDKVSTDYYGRAIESLLRDESKKPFVQLNGYFDAFISSGTSLDLSNVNKDDTFFAYCSDIKYDSLLEMKGLCIPIAQFRDNQQLWVTSDLTLLNKIMK